MCLCLSLANAQNADAFKSWWKDTQELLDSAAELERLIQNKNSPYYLWTEANGSNQTKAMTAGILDMRDAIAEVAVKTEPLVKSINKGIVDLQKKNQTANEAANETADIKSQINDVRMAFD